MLGLDLIHDAVRLQGAPAKPARRHPEWQQATKNLTPEGTDKAAETLNSSYINMKHEMSMSGSATITSIQLFGRRPAAHHRGTRTAGGPGLARGSGVDVRARTARETAMKFRSVPV